MYFVITTTLFVNPIVCFFIDTMHVPASRLVTAVIKFFRHGIPVKKQTISKITVTNRNICQIYSSFREQAVHYEQDDC